ncbi:MAG: hypothetical protein F6J86_30125 [Symploca sp. SIO1B1]|nr:hypothetical protein [Symploca sp. SIO1C2]NER98038.1 hypothetical protein [Symploca sp. SIO1B1]
MAKNKDIFGKKFSPEKFLKSALKENPLDGWPTPKNFKTIALKNPKKAIKLKNIKIVTINNPFFKDDKK